MREYEYIKVRVSISDIRVYNFFRNMSSTSKFVRGCLSIIIQNTSIKILYGSHRCSLTKFTEARETTLIIKLKENNLEAVFNIFRYTYGIEHIDTCG